LWLWIALGLTSALVLGLLWAGQSDRHTIVTPHFTLSYPALWYRAAVVTAAILELCYRVAEEQLECTPPPKVSVIVGLSWAVGFRTHIWPPAIRLGFLLHPWVDGLLFNLSFGVCHEFGHLVAPIDDSKLQEAWAHFFALYALRAISQSQELSAGWRFVLRREYLLARISLVLLQYTWGSAHQATEMALLLLKVVDHFGIQGLNQLLRYQQRRD
jgi:hypothetical protein